MNTFRSLLLFPVLFLMSAILAAQDFVKILPKDMTFAVVTPEAGMFGNLPDHLLSRTFIASGIKEMFSPILRKIEGQMEENEKIWKEETGLSRSDALKQINGSLAIAGRLNLNEFFKPFAGPDHAMPQSKGNLAIVAKFAGTEEQAGKLIQAFLRTLKFMGPDFPKSYQSQSEEKLGVKIHSWKRQDPEDGAEQVPIHWVLADQVLILCGSDADVKNSLLEEMITLMKNGGDSLATAPRYLTAREAAKDAKTFAYFDLNTPIGAWLAAMTQRDIERAQENPEFQQFGPSEFSVCTALGLQFLEAAFIALDMQDRGVKFTYGVTYKTIPGILSFLQFDGPGKLPAFIPKDVAIASYGTYHFQRLFPAVMQLIKEAWPSRLEDIEKELATQKTEKKLDIEADFFGQLGPDFWSAATPPKQNKADIPFEAVGEYTFGIQIKNRSIFEPALEKVILLMSGNPEAFKKIEIQGHTLWTSNIGTPPFGYLITDEWLVLNIGKTDLLSTILKRMKDHADGGIFSQPHVEAVLKSLPGEQDVSIYTDFQSIADGTLSLLPFLKELGETDGFFNPDAVPKQLNLPLSLGSRYYLGPQSLVGRLQIELRVK